jgi:hypothetical protein
VNNYLEKKQFDTALECQRTTSGLGVLRRERSYIFSHADEKMMERPEKVADPSVTLSERGDQTATRC